ncbi:MAG: quinate 5-dehydrogenase [Chloroflexi bacterium]|nr:quinate 5-dehydrogenase [Chloroflexota bacterium]
MKRAVSISIGSSKRDKAVEIELLGERIRIERIGTDGDMEKAAQLFQELDGHVDAFGVGGADLSIVVDGHAYPLHSARKLVRHIRKTPTVDGAGLKNTLEYQLAGFIDRNLGEHVQPRRAFINVGSDRWGMSVGFAQAGYECLFGDLMFALGLNIPIRSIKSVKRLASVLMPIVGRFPFKWLYPTGTEQEKRTPRWGPAFDWATVIAGDALYITRYMPDRLPGKVIATNTTTPADVALFRQAGVKYLVTSTPVLEGRSFGTNMMEAALVAAAGKGRVLTTEELQALIDRLGLQPQLQKLD